MTAVSLLVTGTVGYAIAARECVLSLLENTDFVIHVSCDHVGRMLLPYSPRIHLHPVATQSTGHREDLFLAKFDALKACINHFADHPDAIMIDADVVTVDRIESNDVAAILTDRPMAMVEQKQTLASGIVRQTLYEYYCDVTLPSIMEELPPPDMDAFRYFNSGVVIVERAHAIKLIDWAEKQIHIWRAGSRTHEHLIADQDFIQVWANSVCPEASSELPWQYNHCALWHEDFPRQGGIFLHFSNFCRGPTLQTLSEVHALRRSAPSTTTQSLETGTRLTVVIVGYNSAEVLPLCLELCRQRTTNIVVVDNGSSDQTVEIAERAEATVIRNKKNLGFGVAANIGVRAATTDYICILNPDCILTDEVVSTAIRELERDPGRLLVPDYCEWDGRRIAGLQPGYTRWKILADLMRSGGLEKMPRYLMSLPFYHDRSWHWPLAACLFSSKQQWADLGGFDEDYFLYMEDVRLGQNAAKKGVPTMRLPTNVIHFGSQGSNVDRELREQRINDARLRFARQSYGPVFAAFAEWVLKLSLKRGKKRP